MECGQFGDVTPWSTYSFSDTQSSAVVIDNMCDKEYPASENYLITFPDDENVDYKNHYEINNSQEISNRCYDSPLFISPGEVSKDEITDDRRTELMKSEAKKLGDYKFCEAINDFDIELEAGEAVPIVYLSTTRAAKLQRALRLGGYKKV